MRLLFALFLTLALPALAVAQDGGKIVFLETEHAFGDVTEGAQVEHEFVFTNAGTDPITLMQVRASCGCTTPQWTKKPVAPGEQGRIVVRYDSKNRPGAFRKSIRITASGQERFTTLYITGDVVPAIVTGVPLGNVVVDAEVWDFGAVTPGTPLTHTFKFQNNGTAPLRITSVETGHQALTVEVPNRPIFAGETVEIVASLATDHLRPSQLFDYPITLETTDADGATKTLRVKGKGVAKE